MGNESMPHINCCQKVMMATHNLLGCAEDDAARMGTYLGGGLLGRGEVCGAVTSALMVIGLKGADPLDITAGEAFMKDFENKYGSLRCRDLRPADESHEKCEGYIAWVIQYLEDNFRQPDNKFGE